MKVIALVASVLGLATYAAADTAACPTTLTTINAHLNIGPTSTEYLSTVTSISSVDCGGCGDVIVTSRQLGPGPVASFTTTVTKPEATTTAYVCSVCR